MSVIMIILGSLVTALLAITLVGAVLMITLFNGGLMAVKKLWKCLFGKKD